MNDQTTCVGAIAGAFGVRGEVRLKSFTAEPEDIATYSPLSTEDGEVITVSIAQKINNGFAARIEGVATKEQADAMRGVKLYARRDQLPNLPDDEFYHADLIGLTVLDTGGTALGKVKSVHNHGAGDLLEVHGPNLKSTVLLPFSKAATPTVDLAAGRIIADPPEGLFE